MQDRLAELGVSHQEKTIEEENDTDLEMAEISGESEFMKEFFVEVGNVKKQMNIVRRNIRAIEESYSQALVSVNADQGQKSSEELDKLLDATNLAAGKIRTMLKDIDKQNKKLEKGSAEHRIRTNMHGTLTKKFLEMMSSYQEVQTKYKNKYRERVERQYKIVKPDATDQEIDKALESGNTQVFMSQILDQRHAAAKDALAYIENRHKDILKLQASIEELHQLFLDMAVLVEAQGELIDQIEYNVSQSVAYVKKAKEEITTAKQYQKKSRKKMCCLIVLIVVILIIIALVSGLVGGFVGKK